MSELVWRDLRDWIGAVEHLGELRHVEGASWEWDIGAVTELLDHTPEAPAALPAPVEPVLTPAADTVAHGVPPETPPKA